MDFITEYIGIITLGTLITMMGLGIIITIVFIKCIIDTIKEKQNE